MKRLSSSVQQEPQEMATKRSVWIGTLTVFVAAIAVGGSAALWYTSEEHGWSRPLEPNFANSPLERSPIELHARGLLQKREARDQLQSWTWIDEQEGIVALPIEDAIQWFVASEGSAAPASRIESGDRRTSPEPVRGDEETP